MALETAQYISQLVQSNPLSTDTVAQADDHIRLIKSVLKNTFPNVTGQVTQTHEQINNPIPVGGIIMWSGSSVPDGWALCNGGNGTPDLRNKFIIGAGDSYIVGASGGTLTTAAGGSHTHSTDAAGAHTHGSSTGLTTLTIAQLPAHTHTYGLAGGTAIEVGTGYPTGSGLASVSTTDTGSTGSGQGHGHSITSDGGHTHTLSSVGDHTHTYIPPYYALAFIMKVNV